MDRGAGHRRSLSRADYLGSVTLGVFPSYPFGLCRARTVTRSIPAGILTP
jgi:hypothetical protein